MNLHEYQAKQILKKYGISVPEFGVVSSINELETFLDQKKWESVVLKVQVHAGGRGLAGGVKFAKGKEEILKLASELIGKRIVNEQTGPEGLVAHQLLVSLPVSIKREFYLGMAIHREWAKTILLASPVGGVEIEKTAEKDPSKVLMLSLPFGNAFRSYHHMRIAKFMGWEGELAKKGKTLINAIVKAFIETDGSLLEINPLIETNEGELLCLDAKWSIDENALYRQPFLKEQFDFTQVSPLEARAQGNELAYVALDGNVGCMVNGAGLAMSTMDIIHYYGGAPANFLDVGGGASKEKVAEGFKIILSDRKVKSILVNIFGGIMDCEILASGIIAAANELQPHVPLVVRLEGTNVDKGRALLKESQLPIVSAHDLTFAAKEAVRLAK